MLEAFIALALGGVGIFVLYASWRKFLRGRFAVPVGWSCLALSFLPWALASNVEFASVYGFLALGLGAWLAVAVNYEIRRRHDKPQPAAQAITLDTHSVLQNIGLFCSAVFLAGVAALLLSVTVARLLPWSAVNALVLGVLLLPIFWGLGSYWACADDKPLRPVFALAVGSALCAAWLFV
jgi:hypothetical protein